MAQGSGRLDLPAALALTTTVVPASLSLGLDDPAWADFAGSAVLNVTNGTTTARDYTVSPGEAMPEGITLSVAPGSFTLPPGATASVFVGIHVDNSVVDDVTEPPYGYLGRIHVSSGAEQLRVPFSFVKSTYLKLAFDAPVDAVHAYNDEGRLWSMYSPTGEATMLLPRGQYHLLASGLEFRARSPALVAGAARGSHDTGRDHRAPRRGAPRRPRRPP